MMISFLVVCAIVVVCIVGVVFCAIMSEDDSRAFVWRQTVVRWYGISGGPIDRERIRWICKARRVSANYDNQVTWNPTMEGNMNDALAKWAYLDDEEKELAFCEAQAFLVRTNFRTSA